MIVLQIEIRRNHSGRACCTNAGDYQQRPSTAVISDEHTDDCKYQLYDAQYHSQVLAFQRSTHLIEDHLSILHHCLRAAHLLNYAHAQYFY